MGMGLYLAQTLKSVRVEQHRTALLGQRGESPGDLLLFRHADLQHLTGFLPCGRAAQGGQAQHEAVGILDLAHAVLLSQAEQRCDGIGADRQADVVETERRGELELVVEIARKLAAP